MKPLSSNKLTSRLKIDLQDRERKVGLLDKKSQTSKASTSAKTLSKVEFNSFIQNLSQKYEIISKDNQSNKLSQNKKDESMSLNQNSIVSDLNNQKNNNSVQSSEQDFKQDLESNNVKNSTANKSTLNSSQNLVDQSTAASQKHEQNYYLKKTLNDKMEKNNQQSKDDSIKPTYKGFYSTFYQLNQNPNTYYSHKSSRNEQQSILSKSNYNIDNINQRSKNTFLPNKNLFQKPQRQQGKRITSLPSILLQQNQNQFQKQFWKSENKNGDFNNKSIQQNSQQVNSQKLQNQHNNEQSLMENSKIQNSQQIIQPNKSNMQHQQSTQYKFGVKNSDSIGSQLSAKQAFFKNIYSSLYRHQFDENQSILKNSNILINDVFHINDKDEDNNKAVENVIFIEIQNCKVQKNKFIQENNETREKISNLEKDIKQMNKQLKKWDANKRIVFDEEKELYIEEDCCERIYEDPNFYLISLRQRVKDMKSQVSELNEQIQVYNDTLRTIRTDTKADLQKVELEKQFMLDYQIYRQSQIDEQEHNQMKDEQSQLNKQDGQIQIKNEIQDMIKTKENLKEQIRRIKDDNKVIMLEIQLQQEMQQESDQELYKLMNKASQTQSKLEKIKEEVKLKSPEDLHIKRKLLRQKTLKMEEEKTRNTEMQSHLIRIQYEQINRLKFDFQEFRRGQILENQVSFKQNNDLKTLMNKLKEDYLKVRASIFKKKKMIRQVMLQNNDGKQKVGFQLDQNIYLQENYQVEEDYEEYEDENDPNNKNISPIPSVKIVSQLSSALHSKKPSQSSLKGTQSQQNSLQLLQNFNSFQNPSQIPQSRDQSLCSTDKGNYGESQKSQYNNDEPLSIIFGVQTIDV